MTKKEAIAFLTQDGNLRVPCSRYGHDSENCAEVAYAVDVILTGETGEGGTEESLDYAMGLAVNDHEDIEYLIRTYGREYGFNPEDYLGDEESGEEGEG